MIQIILGTLTGIANMLVMNNGEPSIATIVGMTLSGVSFGIGIGKIIYGN